MEFILIFILKWSPTHLGGLYWISWQLTLSVRRSKLFLLTFSFTLRDLGSAVWWPVSEIRVGELIWGQGGQAISLSSSSVNLKHSHLSWVIAVMRYERYERDMCRIALSYLIWNHFHQNQPKYLRWRGGWLANSDTVVVPGSPVVSSSAGPSNDSTVLCDSFFFLLPAQWSVTQSGLPWGGPQSLLALPVQLAITGRGSRANRNWHFSSLFLHILVVRLQDMHCRLYSHRQDKRETWRPCLYGWWRWFIPTLSSLH